MKSWILIALLVGLTQITTSNALAFGGEDILNGSPWHHQNITERALKGDGIYEGSGFSAASAASIAWHADFIDSYLYSPLWWGQAGTGIIQRLKASIVGFDDLASLHFDDVFTTAGITSTWQKYATGTLVGLYWASLNMDVDAAHNILGVSVHAIQDFYSHTNWVDDPDRRCMTYLQIEPQQRNSMALYSGAYELPIAGAPANHGKYALSCSLIQGEKINVVLGKLCGGFSPFQNTSLCEEWRVCSAATDISMSVAGEVPPNVVMLNPPGIALDTSWLARVQAQNRGLTAQDGSFSPGKEGMYFPREQCKAIVGANRADICRTDADVVFANAKDLAIRATGEWISYIEEAMNNMGPVQTTFWKRVKESSSAQGNREAQFEDFSKLPYQFLSAGPFLRENPDAPAAVWNAATGWFLRLRIETANELGAGTDSDIVAWTFDGINTETGHLLDRLPTTNTHGRATHPLLVYNDFEMGDDDVYMLGPFEKLPLSIKLENDDAGFGDVFEGYWTDFKNGVAKGLSDARVGLLSLIAGNADYVGTDRHNLTTDEIVARLREDEEENTGGTAIFGTLKIDGGIQGAHNFTYRIRPTPSYLSDEEREQGWISVEVQAWKLKTIRESDFDRFSDSDEPFVMFNIAALNGKVDERSHQFLSEPIEDMDTDSEHVFTRTNNSWRIVNLPPGSGGLVLSARIFENDNENQWDRENLLKEFVLGYEKETLWPAEQFERELGRFFGADWTASKLDVFAFFRGEVPQAGQVLTSVRPGLIEGGTTGVEYEFDLSNIRSLLEPDQSIKDWRAEIGSPWIPENDEEVLPVHVNVGNTIIARVGETLARLDVAQCSREY